MNIYRIPLAFLTLTCLSAFLFAEDIWKRKAVPPPLSLSDTASRSHETEDALDTIDQELELYFKERAALEDKQKLEGKVTDTFSLLNKGESEIRAHKVQKDENIWVIAKKYGVSPSRILENNPKLKRRPLYIGETILIPIKISKLKKKKTDKAAPAYHKVQRGETLYGIARKYKVPLNHLQKLNRIKAGIAIQPGDKLRLLEDNGAAPQKQPKKQPQKQSKKQYTKKKLFYWPLRGKITSGFGRRVNPFSRYRVSFHKGIDISAKTGTPFKAAQRGIVIRSRRMRGYGNCIFILHPQNYVSVYAHNKKNLVRKNQIVNKGQVIGFVGQTGAATGPHLHFEVRKLMKPINPIRALRLTKIVRLADFSSP